MIDFDILKNNFALKTDKLGTMTPPPQIKFQILNVEKNFSHVFFLEEYFHTYEHSCTNIAKTIDESIILMLRLFFHLNMQNVITLLNHIFLRQKYSTH